MKVLVTCPPMLRLMHEFKPVFEERGIEVIAPNVVQTLSEDELVALVPQVEGWIIGDDPATGRVFTAGKKGKLRAAVKWGVGVDNVDFAACKKLGIPLSNTPQMFGHEVGALAVQYLLALARDSYYIDREVRKGHWPKPAGISLEGRNAAVIGFGDIGKHVAKYLRPFGLNLTIYDPYAKPDAEERRTYRFSVFPEGIEEADFLVVTCSLNQDTYHMVDEAVLAKMKDGVRIVNVSRGPVIDEEALITALESGKVYAAALDVFETEPLPLSSPLRKFEKCILGTHNGSNTIDAVRRASEEAIRKLFKFMGV